MRDRPLEAAQAADEKHKKFDDEKSEFMGVLKLWKWIEEGRGARRRAHDVHKLTNRQQEQRLRDSFVSPRRVREWRDIHSQLHTVVAEHGWRLNSSAGHLRADSIWRCWPACCGNSGCKADDEEWYLGARGIKFWRHPGAHLSKKPGRWLVAAELVETTRLFGRGLAAIEPQWIPPLAGHLLKTQLLEPHWEKKAAEVVALERATLYGIVIYNNRRVNFGRVDPVAAREIFIREALVGDEWETRLPFLAHNRKLLRAGGRAGAQGAPAGRAGRRRADLRLLRPAAAGRRVLGRDAGALVPRGGQEPAQAAAAHARRADAPRGRRHHRPRPSRRRSAWAASTARRAYLHEPGDAKDGLTVTVPIYALNQVSEERCEWLVPGMLPNKVLALVKSLHQRPRSRLRAAARLRRRVLRQRAVCAGRRCSTRC